MSPRRPGDAGPAPSARGSGPPAGTSQLAELLVERLDASDLEAGRAFTVAELRRSLLPYPMCRERLGIASKAEYDLALLRLLGHGWMLETEDQALREDVLEELDSPEPGLGVLDDHAAASVRPGQGLGRVKRAPGSGGAVGDGGAPRPAAGGEPGGPDAADPAGTADRRDEGPPPREPGPAAGSAGDGGERKASSGDGVAGRGSGDETGPPTVGTEGKAAGRGETAPKTPETPASDGDARSNAPRCGACGADLPEVEGVRYCPACGAGLEDRRCRDCGEDLDAGWRFCPFCGSERRE